LAQRPSFTPIDQFLPSSRIILENPVTARVINISYLLWNPKVHNRHPKLLVDKSSVTP
jgi:hypothetical protein